MTQDRKAKRAARSLQASTGVPYTKARRATREPARGVICPECGVSAVPGPGWACDECTGARAPIGARSERGDVMAALRSFIGSLAVKEKTDLVVLGTPDRSGVPAAERTAAIAEEHRRFSRYAAVPVTHLQGLLNALDEAIDGWYADMDQLGALSGQPARERSARYGGGPVMTVDDAWAAYYGSWRPVADLLVEGGARTSASTSALHEVAGRHADEPLRLVPARDVREDIEGLADQQAKNAELARRLEHPEELKAEMQMARRLLEEAGWRTRQFEA